MDFQFMTRNKQWGELLKENASLYSKGEPLMMNLFPYFEDLKEVRERGVIDEMKQKSG